MSGHLHVGRYKMDIVLCYILIGYMMIIHFHCQTA